MARSRGRTTVPGYVNDNNQRVVRRTDTKSCNHNGQNVYVLHCENCEHEYGANGCDIWLRLCPNCNENKAKPGLPYE